MVKLIEEEIDRNENDGGNRRSVKRQYIYIKDSPLYIVLLLYDYLNSILLYTFFYLLIEKNKTKNDEKIL